jgi:hypothetical protein
VVEVALPVGAHFVSGILHFRRGGDSDYRSVPLVLDELGRPLAAIPDSLVGPRGLDYWIEVQTLTRPLTFPANDPAGAPATLRTLVQNLAEPELHPAEGYRVLAIPLDFGTDTPRRLEDLSMLGSYDPLRWRAFRFDPASQSTIELPATSPLDARLQPGRAFWLVTRGPHRIDIAPLTGRSTPTDRPYPLALEPGWNLIGNPFCFPVVWDSVPRSAAIDSFLTVYDAPLGRYLRTQVLAPFQGGFVFNEGAAAETLWVPPAEAPAPAPRPALVVAADPMAVSTPPTW